MDMKKIKLTAFLTLMLAAMALVQGCALLLLGGAAAGAAYGTVKYVNNTLDVTQEVSLDKAWKAANAALKELQMPVTVATKDGATGRLEALNAKHQPVVIQTIRKTDTVTEIQITVGTFESTANQTEAQQIYDRMKARF
jgi:conjugal transfer/entry exclusion protein